MIQIRLAKHKGYCFGVKRAIEMVEKALEEGPYPIWTLGPVIHNPVVVDELTKRGVRIANDISQVDSGTLILRTHGTTLEERQKIPPTVRFIDATCPFVARAQKEAAGHAAAGRTVLIVGDKDHPEVKGILSHAGPDALCVRKASEIDGIPFEDIGVNVGLVAQTTSKKEDVEQVIKKLKKKGISVDLANTICTATEERQQATRELAKECDLVLVVGGRTSANTRQLLRIAKECSAEAYLVESAEDVLPEWFKGKHIVGVTAGASTPDRVIKEVVGKVEELEKANLEQEPEEVQEENRQEQVDVQQPEAQEQVASEEAQADPQEDPSEEPSEEEKTPEQLYDETFKTLREGDIVKGKVMSVDENGALVDVGYKSEGLVPAHEFQRRGALAPEKVAPGDEIMVYVLSVDSNEGGLRLSKRKADEEIAWKKLEQAYLEQDVVEAPVAQEVKGGLVVDVGVRGFVPASQVERGYVNDLSKYVGQTLRMKVLELDRSKNRVILSQRVVLEEEHERLCKETWETIAEGQVRTGIVKGITDFGVFVDLGGVDGLLHISELSWGRVNHPSEVVREGQELEVKVLKVDRERGRISLGRKQVLPDPWDNVEEKYPVGAVIKGEVTRTAPFGAFVQVELGVEGLVHISEISQQHIAKPEDVVNSGDTVMVKVLRTRPEERKISLSIRQADQILLEGGSSRDDVESQAEAAVELPEEEPQEEVLEVVEPAPESEAVEPAEEAGAEEAVCEAVEFEEAAEEAEGPAETAEPAEDRAEEAVCEVVETEAAVAEAAEEPAEAGEAAAEPAEAIEPAEGAPEETVEKQETPEEPAEPEELD
ncbi:MAG TPA: bifunctional 4-hydroxy-3-methylbut-2-enyl diphosphate reductase/30S ribosomal protein S1 [Firmicutes bacterium]|nr:bifunctional 4-hydroxy-3-methylbut-2-enyl diphosphate reductase/30S ribosomal protein S1 [Candidatus Fermentithermobacillaceae bacterium]